MRQLNFAARDEQVFVRRANVDHAGSNRFTVFSLFDTFSGLASEQLCQLTFVAGIKVLHDYDRRRRFRIYVA